MAKINFPLIYHPTTTVMVDDNQGILDSMQYALEARDLLVQTYVAPEEALAYLNGVYQPSPIFDESLKRLPEYAIEAGKPQAGMHAASMYIHHLHRAIYDPQRFDEVAVIFVDYQMPGMNGIEFCRQLAKHPAKKIILTGEADESLAVEAFNDGIIDQFLRKGDPRCQEKLLEVIKHFSLQYFIERSQTLVDNLTAKYDFSCPLNSPSFCEMVQRMHDEHGILEHYILDAGGSFLMLDGSGKLNWFAVQSEEDMDMFVDLAVDSGAGPEVIMDLQARDHLPFFANPDQLSKVKGSAWRSYLYPAHVIADLPEVYYSAWIEDKSFGLVNEDIVGYAQFFKRDEEE